MGGGDPVPERAVSPGNSMPPASSSHSSRDPGGDRGGFAVLIVVFLLFAVGVAAATAHQIVQGQLELAGYSYDGGRASAAAEAGLNRYLGEHFGGTPEPEAFSIGGADVFVDTRRVQYSGLWNEIHRVRSEGRVVDPRHFDSPSVRTSSRYALLRQPPFHVEALMASSGPVNVGGSFVLDGNDQASGGACRPAVGASLPGTGGVGELEAPPWSFFTDPALTVDHEYPAQGWPIMPPGNYQAIRVSGDFNANAARSGRGFLIVTGEISFGAAFLWEGVILAGRMEGIVNAPGMDVQGLVVVGLDGDQPPIQLSTGSFRYHSCHAYEAGRAASYLSPLPSSWWLDY